MHRRKHAAPESAPQLLLTIPQVAVALSLGRTKVYELIKYEGLPTVPLGGAVRVSLSSLQEWITQREKRIGA
jgi:excisionase family DNA binding protein